MPRIKNAFFYRIHVRAWLAVALVGCLPVAAQAAYAQLAPPSGFGGSAGNWTFAPSANDVRYGGTAYSPNALRVPVSGSSATMPAAYRFASNAPRVAAAAIFSNPYVRVGVGVATWLGVSSLIYDEVEKIWRQQTEKPDGTVMQYRYMENSWTTLSGACSQVIAYFNNADAGSGYSNSLGSCGPHAGGLRLRKGPYSTDSFGFELQSRTIQVPDQCPTGWTPSGAGCLSPAIQQPEFVEKLNPPNTANPMPETVPWELPKPTPLPIEQPVINPSPGENPVPRPLFVPTGNPVPNPQYDPNSAPGPDNQPWIQPGVRVSPSPTLSEPWRVDLQPVNRPVSGPEPMPEPDSENPPNADKPSDEQLDFCAKNPDVLACSKPDLDTPDGEIPKSNKDVSLVEENLFGGGACPADVYFTPHGLQQFKVWDWNQSCGYISGYVKPILIICCTFAAFMILIPGRTE